MNRKTLPILVLLLVFSCKSPHDIITDDNNVNNLPKYNPQVVKVETRNYIHQLAIDEIENNPLSLNTKTMSNTRAAETRDSIWLENFGYTVFASASECIVLPHLERYLYPGSILKGNSIHDATYAPIVADINPITISVSLAGVNNPVKTITRPNVSSLRTFINEVLKSQISGFQNGSLNYSIEQFSNYDELKVEFGSNYSTGALFWSNSGSSNTNQYKISRNAGLYISFTQRNFTVDMDIPSGPMINGTLSSSQTGGVAPVYVSSITYGRKGILTIETNETSEHATSVINEAFKKIFYNKQTSLTQEEKRVIDAAYMKLFLIGGNGQTAVQTIYGVEGFIEHIINGGTFSASNPGVPIYASFSYLTDHSPVKIPFEFDIFIDPLYVKLSLYNTRYIGGSSKEYKSDYKLQFFRDRDALMPVAPPSNIEFPLVRHDFTMDAITFDKTAPITYLAPRQNRYVTGYNGVHDKINTTLLSQSYYKINNSFRSTEINIAKDVKSVVNGLDRILTVYEVKRSVFYKILFPEILIDKRTAPYAYDANMLFRAHNGNNLLLSGYSNPKDTYFNLYNYDFELKYDIYLTDVGNDKMAVIKAFHDVTQCGLAETKKIIDGFSKSVLIKGKVHQYDRDIIQSLFDNAGATIKVNRSSDLNARLI